MEYFKSLTENDLIQIINQTKSELLICLPSIHGDLANAIVALSNSKKKLQENIAIHLLIDFDATTFRQGYGDFGAVESLIKNSINIKSLKDNRISFIISDNTGYYLFTESRSLIPADKKTNNAITIDPVSLVRILDYFYKDIPNFNLGDRMSNAIILESKRLLEPEYLIEKQVANIEILKKEKIDSVAKDLENNPPIKPDYKRIVEIYTNKFQYIKLKFTGANLKTRKISLSTDVLPIADAELKKRLETKLNLFTDEKLDKTFDQLNNFKNSILKIREKYLLKVKSREESLIDKMKKNSFEKELSKLKNDLEKVKDYTASQISLQIIDLKKRLVKDLTEFFEANPKSMFAEKLHLFNYDIDDIKKLAEDKATGTIHNINWPKIENLVKEFKLDVQYSDITYEDLTNPQFILELKENNLINADDVNELAVFGRTLKLN